MTAEELGQLFPIRIADYNPEWPELFTSERKNIIEAVGNEFISRIEHIGSTSVPGLCASLQLTYYWKYWKSQIVIF